MKDIPNFLVVVPFLIICFLAEGINRGISASSPDDEFSVVPKLTTAKARGLYIGNRDPLLPSPLMKLPIGSITPKGWLRSMLELEKSGMTGRLVEISPWLKWENSAWANPHGQGERGWEELPYWLKGYGDLGYVLNDVEIIREARKWIEAVLSSQWQDGWFGPRNLLTALQGNPDMWPNMVMLNVLQSFYEFTGDKRVLQFMLNYFRWQNQLPAEGFGAGYWPKLRMGDNIESVYWLYNRTAATWLLNLAKKMHENMARWDEDVINWHNVNIAQGFREPAVYCLQSKNPQDLEAAERNYRKVMDTYGQFAGGGFAADENARPGFMDPRQGFETCGFVEFMHSFEMLTKISGDPIWSDRCEEIAFNSFPAALTPDLKALHYLTCANQVQLDKKTKSPGVQNGGTMFSYSPFHVYRCCQHNVSHGWPYYAEELWLATADHGLCAVLYSASEVSARVGNGIAIKIVEETDYPFDNIIRFKLSTPKKVKFPLYLRVPRWSKNSIIKINGKPINMKAEPLSYIVTNRLWRDDDEITLQLDMQLLVHRWEKNKNSVSIDYGPLTFSLKIEEQWQRYGDNEQWHEWEVFPASAWNFGLVLDPVDPKKSFKLVSKPGRLAAQPFTPETVHLQLQVKARKIPNWQQDYLGLVGLLQASPASSNEPDEIVTLIPMGAAHLRITSFPTVSSGPEAHEWIPPQQPKPIPFNISVSYFNRYDLKEAVADGFEPKSSNDESIPRLTWWDHKGTLEWLQYDFPAPRMVSSISIYWFDDTPDGGGCSVPQSWKLFYKKNDSWLPVVTESEFGTKRDSFNTIKFKTVETNALRIEVQLQPNFSGGILELKFEE